MLVHPKEAAWIILFLQGVLGDGNVAVECSRGFGRDFRGGRAQSRATKNYQNPHTSNIPRFCAGFPVMLLS